MIFKLPHHSSLELCTSIISHLSNDSISAAVAQSKGQAVTLFRQTYPDRTAVSSSAAKGELPADNLFLALCVRGCLRGQFLTLIVTPLAAG